MLIDCSHCQMRDIACDDCVVSALLGAPSDQAQLTPAEQRAIKVLVDAGMVSPLQLVVVERDDSAAETEPGNVPAVPFGTAGAVAARVRSATA